MREILFRGKRVDNGEWVEGFPFTYNGKYCIQLEGIECDDYGLYPRCYAEVITESISEFTGLTDENGKKIFEGDIVLYVDEEGYYPEEQCEFVGRIVFEKGAFGIATDDNIPIDLNYWCDNDNFVSLWELYWNLSVDGDELDVLEIIGNIHDNPELLKGETNA